MNLEFKLKSDDIYIRPLYELVAWYDDEWSLYCYDWSEINGIVSLKRNILISLSHFADLSQCCIGILTDLADNKSSTDFEVICSRLDNRIIDGGTWFVTKVGLATAETLMDFRLTYDGYKL